MMEKIFEPLQAARFLRTLRVATGVAISQEEIRRGRGRATPAASFLALAARSVGPWQFPDDGILSADGLLLAKRMREADGSGALALQAQGAVGVSTFAGRPAAVRVGEAWFAEGAFDRFGAMRLPLAENELEDAELARFEVEFLDGAV
jgi:hypothetical protein